MPIHPTVKVGEEIQFTALARYSDGSVRQAGDSVAWSASGVLGPPAVRGTTGLVVGSTAGNGAVTATYAGLSGGMEVAVVDSGPPALTLLSVSPRNPRYFQNAEGRVVYLTGSHTWLNLQEVGAGDPPAPFDYGSFLSFLAEHGHNFFRLWSWEQSRWMVNLETDDLWITPTVYERPGPGEALDGHPKFDLDRLDPAYFDRLRARVEAAGERGIYVAVMLFDGWSVAKAKGQFDASNPWRAHPFNRANNINDIDGDPDGDESGEETHELTMPAVTELQLAYVRAVIDAVGDLDNVLWEVSNESHAGSQAWQYAVVDFVRRYEATRPKQHPVGLTAIWPDGDNRDLYAGHPDWISPNDTAERPLADPPPADGRAVVISDTDHLCGICGDRKWVWKAFTRGQNPIFMDIYDEQANVLDPHDLGDPRWGDIRRALGYTRMLAQRLDLARLVPRGGLASTGYCLAGTDHDEATYVVYMPAGGSVEVDLAQADGFLGIEWMNPRSGTTHSGGRVQGGGKSTFSAPFSGDAVLVLHGGGVQGGP